MRCGWTVCTVGSPRWRLSLTRSCQPCWKQKKLTPIACKLTSTHIVSLFRTLSWLIWRTPLKFWRPKIQRPRKSFRGLSVIQTSHQEVENMLSLHIVVGTLFLHNIQLSSSVFSCHSELLINRQNSSESISSLTSTTSHSSMGSVKEQEAKKKKKKSWVRTL